MRKIFFALLLFSSVVLAQPAATVIKLPEPDLNGRISIEQAIKNCGSTGQFTAESLKMYQVSQLCWSAQGIADYNENSGSVPSATASYPIQLYLALPDGLYLYYPQKHMIEKRIEGDIRTMLSTASFGQKLVLNSPCIFIITGSAQKMEAKFRGRGEKLLYFETGRIVQNINLQAVTLGLGSAPVDNFDYRTIDRICKFPEGLDALYMVCIGNLSQPPVLESAVGIASVMRPVRQPVKAPVDITQKKIVIVLPAKYFNDSEFFGTLNAIQMAGIQPDIASTVLDRIKSLEGNAVKATKLVTAIKVSDYDAFIFIGGYGARMNSGDLAPLTLVREANNNKKVLAAIGSAPGIFARAGIVRGKNVASSLSERGRLINAGANWENTPLEVSGNIITANSYDSSDPMSNTVTQRFGAAVLNALRQQDK